MVMITSDVALAQARGANTQEARLLLGLPDIARAAVAHPAAEAAHQLAGGLPISVRDVRT